MFQPTDEITISEQQAAFAKFAPRFEARLKENSTGSCAGTRLSFADVILTEALSLYMEWIPYILEPTPLLKALNETVLSQPGIKAYFEKGRNHFCSSLFSHPLLRQYFSCF